MEYIRNVKSKKLKNKVCLLRLDFNAEDDWRLEASLPTIKYLSKHCESVVILGHKGRPKKRNKALSLAPYTKIISKNIKKKVSFIEDFNFQKIKNKIDESSRGSIFLLENLRFLDGESKNDEKLAKNLACLGNIYINEAFAVSHRKNASIATITKYIDSYAGLEFEKEIKNLSKIFKNPKKPLVIVIGGNKVSGKLETIKPLYKKTYKILVGGSIYNSKFNLKSSKFLLAPDFIKKDNGFVCDLGPTSRSNFCKILEKAKTIIWNGPLGEISERCYWVGSDSVAKCISENKKAFKIAGGGETVMLLKKLKLDKKFDFISTGGGAMLSFISGRKLAGIKALNRNKK